MRPPPPSLPDVARDLIRDFGLLLGRLLTGWTLVIFHGWGESLAGYRHFFGAKEPWPLVEILSQAGLRPGLPWAVVFTFAMVSCAAAFFTGLLTRVAAVVLLVVCAIAGVVSSADELQEAAAGLAAVAVVILFAGPGRFSVDGFFRWRRARANAPKPKYR